jgi:hypothetical protein
MSALRQHIQKQQEKAMRLEYLLNAAYACVDDPDCIDVVLSILESGRAMARELNEELDGNRLPEEAHHEQA